jgi:hypothetical protein
MTTPGNTISTGVYVGTLIVLADYTSDVAVPTFPARTLNVQVLTPQNRFRQATVITCESFSDKVTLNVVSETMTRVAPNARVTAYVSREFKPTDPAENSLMAQFANNPASVVYP